MLSSGTQVPVLQSGALAKVSVFVPDPNVPSEPFSSVKTDPPDTVTSAPLEIVSVLLLSSENRLPFGMLRKLPPATLKSAPLLTVSVLACSLTSASEATSNVSLACCTRFTRSLFEVSALPAARSSRGAPASRRAVSSFTA